MVGKLERITKIRIEKRNKWPIESHKWKSRKVIATEYKHKFILPKEIFGYRGIIYEKPRESKIIAREFSLCVYIKNEAFFHSNL